MAKELRRADKKSNIVTIPTGVDPLPIERKQTEAFKKRFGISEQDKVVMYAGRLAPEKNLDLLIDAFDYIGNAEPAAKLCFVGDFSYREQLEAHAADSKFPDRIIFTGRLPREELGSVYAAADVFAFPSLTDTQALVINEAALSQVPIVWVDQGINEVLVHKKTGLRARNTPKDFAKKVNALLGNEKHRLRYGRAAEELALGINERTQTKKLVAVLDKIIAEHH